jgi:outer membrane lipoprotein-sorting protein
MLFVVGAFAVVAHAQQPLDVVLERMAEVGGDFRSLEADIERTHVVVIVDDHSASTGKLYFEGKGEDSRIRMKIEAPAAQDLLVAEGRARHYNPRTNVVQEFDLGDNPQIVQFFVLGFGQSAVDLPTQHEVTLTGEEVVDGVSTVILDLKPRSERVSGMFKSFRLWVDQTRWIPVQAQVTEAGGDYNIVKYSNIKTNERISGSRFDLKLPKNVQVIRP